ncbi:MAG: PPOX class F420-dependent oxidoreductase [Acidimicrobiales bacterium]
MDISKAQEFVKQNHRGVLLTHRRDGTPQLSPVTPGLDADGRVVVSSRETAMKTKNLRRDPRASLCVFTDGFYGDWVQIDGRVEIVALPDALPLLEDYYRRISGEHPDWHDYRATMVRDRRVVLRITMERAGPDRSG